MVNFRVVFALGILGCAPKVHFTILDAADLMLPPEIHVLAVSDQTGVPEGRAAVAGFTRWLATSKRFVAAGPGEVPDATVIVEGFDSDSTLVVEDGTTIRTSRVVTTWRLVDRAGVERDLLAGVATVDRWSATPDPDETAAGIDRPPGSAGAIPTSEDSIRALAESSGVAYARRLTAVTSSLSRTTFVRGDPRLRYAQSAVRAGDWKRAIRLWTEVSRSEDPTVAARAHYDLAVGYEVGGEIRRALDHVREAEALDDDARIARYREALDRVNGDTRPLRPIDRPPGSAGAIGETSKQGAQEE